jgi:hypothetical protein
MGELVRLPMVAQMGVGLSQQDVTEGVTVSDFLSAARKIKVEAAGIAASADGRRVSWLRFF